MRPHLEVVRTGLAEIELCRANSEGTIARSYLQDAVGRSEGSIRCTHWSAFGTRAMDATLYSVLAEPATALVSESRVEDKPTDAAGPPHARNPIVDVMKQGSL